MNPGKPARQWFEMEGWERLMAVGDIEKPVQQMGTGTRPGHGFYLGRRCELSRYHVRDVVE